MKGKDRELNLGADELNLRLLNAWRQVGPLRSFDDSRFGETKEFFAAVKDSRAIIRASFGDFSFEHAMWFERDYQEPTPGTNGQKEFPYAFLTTSERFAPSQSQELLEIINQRIRDLPNARRRDYEKYFGSPFSQVRASDVILGSPIVSLPVGRNGRLSTALFDNLYNVITLPTARYTLSLPKLKPSVWFSFQS